MGFRTPPLQRLPRVSLGDQLLTLLYSAVQGGEPAASKFFEPKKIGDSHDSLIHYEHPKIHYPKSSKYGLALLFGDLEWFWANINDINGPKTSNK